MGMLGFSSGASDLPYTITNRPQSRSPNEENPDGKARDNLRSERRHNKKKRERERGPSFSSPFLCSSNYFSM